MFCTNCGHQLLGSENFCPKCGHPVQGANPNTKRAAQATAEDTFARETLTFSSTILLGGNLVRPDRIVIDDKNVTYEKRNKHLIGVDKVVIPFSRIASVELDRRLISSRIIIYSKGSQNIVVENFTVGDGRKIKAAIEERL